MTIDARRLLAALSDRHAVSGSELAARLSVTRAAVWKQIEALRDLGAPIDAEAGTGYRLAWPFEALSAERIVADLPAASRTRLGAIDVHWSIDSTNSELMRQAAAGNTAAAVCIAETQSGGRGRRGRRWQSPLGGNLAFSLRWPFAQGMGTLAGLSLAVGVAATQALADVGVTAGGDDGVGLKWPNDLVARERKLGGILVELGGEFLGPCHAVIGIGINLRLSADAQAAIDQPAIDAASLVDPPPSRNALAARLIMRLVGALDRFAIDGFAPFRDDFARLDLLAGQPLRVLGGEAAGDAVGAGVDERGALLVRRGRSLLRLDSAEVSVRPAAPRARARSRA